MSINLLTITLRRAPNSAGVLSANDYLLSVTSLANGHDYATVRAQSGIDNPTPQFPNGSQQRLNIGGYFTKGLMSEEIDNSTGLTTFVLPFHCNRGYPGYSDVTVANAFDKYNAARAAHAQAAGITDFYNWYTDYIANNYTTTWTATDSVSPAEEEWWLDHETNWADPVLNKPAI